MAERVREGTGDVKFSVVIPVGNQPRYIEQNLPSWCSLQPDEVVLCFDNPAPEECVEASRRICETSSVELKVLEVEANPEYRFQQAWIRRSGFRAARNDAILTGDIDLSVFQTCRKAVSMVGRDNIGLVSLMKIRSPSGTQGFIRRVMDHWVRNVMLEYIRIIDVYLNKIPQKEGAFFTGLYAVWRPFWLRSEDTEEVKKLWNPKAAPFLQDTSFWGGYCGEDTLLWRSMRREYRCVHLLDIGAVDHGVGLEETEGIQWKIGRYHFDKYETPLYVIQCSIINVRPIVLASYMHELSKMCGSPVLGIFRALQDCFRNICIYLPFRIGFRLLFGKKERDRIFEQYGISDSLRSVMMKRREQNA